MSVSLFLKDPASARYVAGGFAEVEELLGSPLPDLPAPEIDQGREVYAFTRSQDDYLYFV